MSFINFSTLLETDAQWNYSSVVILDDIKMDSNFAWLLCSLFTAMAWITFITYYDSRLFGYIITKLVNKFYTTDEYFKIGSIAASTLAGKIMFRDVVYITRDYSVRIQDGYVIFRWWRSYVPKDVSEDLSHSDTRLSVVLNGFELHTYNRSKMYARCERLFGLEPTILPDDTTDFDNDKDNSKERPQPGSSSLGKSWRDLIPVIKVDIVSGRLVFGNRYVPTTLSIQVEEAHFVYSTKSAASRLDHFMHFVKCKAENFKVILAPSPKYTGISDDPPRYMGEGFVVLSSNNIDLYYYMDEPGIVPEEPLMLELANGDIVESDPPIWGIDIKCGKGTDFSYGPWADRHREHLFKLFFPQDYQSLKVTKPPLPGEKRQVQSFDIRLSTLNDATIDILFYKNKETNAVHVNIGPGSYLEVTVPWIVSSDGYTTKVTGQLLHLEATTSLQYRSLFESETLEYNVKCHYPLKWNGHQDWTLDLTACKATIWFIYAHKEFFQELIIDWSPRDCADLLLFIPYTWKLNILMKEFEFIMPANEYNWVDCSSQNNENMYIAFCGDSFDFSFDLPFDEFLPESLLLKFWIQGESMDLGLYLPDVYTSRTTLLSLDRNAKLLGRDGNITSTCSQIATKKWRSRCKREDGWLDCWSVPIVALSIHYLYHPMPCKGPPPQADMTTPEKEEILLSPMRIQKPGTCKSSYSRSQKQDTTKFDPTSLKGDKVNLELEISPSQLLIYGSWIRGFVHLKENIFGDDQVFTDMNEAPVFRLNPTEVSKTAEEITNVVEKDEIFDPRIYRPLEVTVSITMHDIQAHLVKNCSEKDPPCPVILLERFGFEMKKNYRETQLQLLLSPAILISSDKVQSRPIKDKHLKQGHLMLSGFQLRGHAMFSDEGRNLGDETLEYAWLLELQLGTLSGKMTTPQLFNLVTSLESLLMLTLDTESRLLPPKAPPPCHHNKIPVDCPESDPSGTYRCPPPEQIKYRMVRVSLDALDFFILESGTAIHLWASPVRFSTCNLHGNQVKSGLTGVIPAVKITQTILTNNLSANSTTGSGRSQYRSNSEPDIWLEVGSISFGPLILEAAVSLSKSDQNLHLVQNKYLKTHDERTKRLWLLWHGDKTGRCGCIGGCAFFGNNCNGARFFKPSKQDIIEGINVAAFRINDVDKDPGYGQSILQESQLVFHTSPYNTNDITIYDPPSLSTTDNIQNRSKGSKTGVDSNESPKSGSKVERSRSVTDNHQRKIETPSPVSSVRSGPPRRFSYTSSTASHKSAVQNGVTKEVPYSRLVDTSPITNLPPKLDSDSRLHANEKTRSILSVPEVDNLPKPSISDSKLAVDYFNSTALQYNALVNSVQPQLDPSESDHSLQEQLVQRTISLTSENQSDIFFSAEEEFSQAMGLGINSRSSSLRRSATLIRQQSSGTNSADIDGTKKRYGSDMNIVSGSVGTQSVLSNRLSTYKSENEIHTPLHRIEPNIADVEVQKSCLTTPLFRHSAGGSSPKTQIINGLQQENQDGLAVLFDSSDTHSVSSTSFISALSSQEDLSMVNLHKQVNKPIIESPLLMTTYVNHLTQVTCTNWTSTSFPSGSDAFTTPLFQKTEEDRLIYIGSQFTPKFMMLMEGFTSLKMMNRNKDAIHSPPMSLGKTPTHPYSWDFVISENGKPENNPETEIQEELLSSRNESGTRTTVVVKMKGDLNIMITPLVLESLQRFVDALTPTLNSLHIVTVLTSLHLSCCDRVEASNILKRDQYLNHLQGGGSKRSTAERNQNSGGIARQPHTLVEQCISTQTQATIIFPKINIALLQVSVVEEVISFSALENIRDLTCVSLLAISLENLNASFHFGKQTKEIVETFERPAVLPSGAKKSGFAKRVLLLGPRTSSAKHVLTGETVYIETSQKQQEEMVISVNLSKVHTQLRRLQNESSLLKDAEITAIPSHCSKVTFTTRMERRSNDDNNLRNIGGEDLSFIGLSDEKMGFIMFEGGLEGISFKVVKRSKFDIEENNGERLNAKVETHIENETNYTDSLKSKDALDSVAIDTSRTSGSNQQDTSTTTPTVKSNLKNSSTSDQKNTLNVINNKNDGNTSSCIIEFRQVWFNFAAPPRTPITRKIDYTRLDWNLLSTASPAINAWMNPSNRFAIRVVHMLRCKYRRSTAVMTCLMAEALEVHPIYTPIKSRYGRFTPLCKTLQEDPSCQLCCVLKRYLIEFPTNNVEDNLKDVHVPHLSTLRQGVIVLSRQWKNILYTPLLLEHSIKKSRVTKPMNVTFAVPNPEEENMLTDGEFSCEDCEVTDECAMLLNSDTGVNLRKTLKKNDSNTNVGISNSPNTHHLVLDSQAMSSLTSPSSAGNQNGMRKRSLLPTQVPSSSRASIVFPLLNATNPFLSHSKNENIDNKGIGYSALKDDYNRGLGSQHSLYSKEPGGGSLPSLVEYMGDVAISPPTSGGLNTAVNNSENKKLGESEDLYTWMAKQQQEEGDRRETASARAVFSKFINAGRQQADTKETEPVNIPSTNPDYLILSSGYSLYPMHDSLKLLDAHLIFEPLLTSLGVMPQQMISTSGLKTNSLDSWGTNLSLTSSVDSMRIDIVVSEYGKTQDKSSKPHQKPTDNRLWIEMPPETPAFLCEKIGLELELCRSADTTIVEDLSRQRHNMLYVSRGQLKKHSNTTLNVSVSIRYISQQVNMPLLRLLLQISNMYQNVKETQSELRDQQSDNQKVPAKTPPAASAVTEGQATISSIDANRQESFKKFNVTDDKTMLSPSSSIRTQSVTNRLRSSARSGKGENSPVTTPVSVLDRRISVKSKDDSITVTPRCWKTVYNLLDLYATMPHTRTIAHSRFSVVGDQSDSFRSKKSDSTDTKEIDIEKGENVSITGQKLRKDSVVGTEEKTRLIVFAVAKIHKTRLLATLSGLKLEAEMANLHSSMTIRKKTKPSSMECSVTGHVGRTMIVLLEGVPPNQQTVVKIMIGKSQALISSMSIPGKDKNSALLSVSSVAITIPQHPVALHGMMARGSKHLSSTLQELRVTRTSSRLGRPATIDEVDVPPHSPQQLKETSTNPFIVQVNQQESLLQPLVIQFTIMLQSLSITAALLPSLQAQYKMEQLSSSGVTASKAKFVIDLPSHFLSFSTKSQSSDVNVPPEASIKLPKVHVSAEYVQDSNLPIEDQFADGVVLRQGNYLNAVADIGEFDHSLTTDLLNHLVFVQKVFMKEVNEVVQKVYGGEKPVPFWEGGSSAKQILFSLVIRLTRIQLTAVTPTNCAVRLETGCVDLQLSNRVENISGKPNAATKLFAKATVDINLSLGQLIKNALFEEAIPEFQPYAFFKTRIGLRNAFQGEMVDSGNEGKEVVLITLRRPLIYIQPMAIDKAILVWLNYKNAYEYWNEQRSSLNSEVLTATQQVFEKMPFDKITGPPFLGTLFLQLSVEDMGICLPLNPLPPPVGRGRYPDDSCSAVVVTLESTSISACSWGSLVSKARFVGLCLRFADDFEISLDDWKPELNESAMNLCVVSEGTYEVCSRTVAAQKTSTSDNAKWFLNVQWAMQGVDIHLDVNIGKQLSALGHTLTTLTGYQEEEGGNRSYDSDEIDTADNAENSQESPLLKKSRPPTLDSLCGFALDPTVDSKKRSKLIEKELNEQAKIINDLRALGASEGTIEQETRRLRELENMVFNDFRRDMIQKLRRQSVKTSLMKRKTMSKSAFRSRSFIVPSPTLEDQFEMDSPNNEISSLCSSPPTSLFSRSHPTPSPRVTFSGDSHNFPRQSSLPSTSSELSLPGDGDLTNWKSNRHSTDNIPPRSDSADNGTLLFRDIESSTTGSSPTAIHLQQKPTEPNIDFELDVKVLINRGKCVLHTKDQQKDDDLKGCTRIKKERSCSGGMFDFTPLSPSTNRRSQKYTSTSRVRHQANLPPGDVTIFHIPGLDVKVHYESKTLSNIMEGSIRPDNLNTRGPRLVLPPNTKKASLFAWMTLHSIPEETVISPHILDFLERTLEPIPTLTSSRTSPVSGQTGAVNAMFTGDSTNTTAAVQYYASFPVDVIVYFHIQPSTFRFSCHPVSRVECMLQLPSVDIVLSSKRADSSSPSPNSTVNAGSAGGISITTCLSDFSLYIFHPYTGKKSGVKESHLSPLQDTERKDSLSVNVEFVKLHLSRSRKLNVEQKTPADQCQAVVRFSTIVDIGSASFKYDMRRLTEILAFPKAWYRRTIMRRLFLGDLSTAMTYSDGEDSDPEISNIYTGLPIPINQENMKLKVEHDLQKQINFRHGDSTGSSLESSPGDRVSNPTWETLVLFAVHFKRLNVHMNMGNVMGNVMLLTKDFKSEGRLSIGSSGHKDLFIGFGLAGASLDAKGGIVGGAIDLSNIDTFVTIKEDKGIEPHHVVGVKLYALESRLDYMGTSVLMARVSCLEVALRDEWRTVTALSINNYEPRDGPTKRPAQVFIHGDLIWDQLQIMISKSTTVDVLKMYIKLEEFFNQQFKSSKRVFSSLGKKHSTTEESFRGKKEGTKKKTSTADGWIGAGHHRHWQKALSLTGRMWGPGLSGLISSSNSAVLGGTIDLRGTNISLACFHGINFKSKSWALFSLKESFISYSTEAQQVLNQDTGHLDSHIVETLTFSLGMTQDATAQHDSMATVCRVSRNVVFPPQFKTLHDWFHYTFSCSEIDAVDRFPSLEREKDTETVGRVRMSKSPDLNHTREVIFALPSFQTVLKTEHLQAFAIPSISEGKPIVECSFVTDFEDHIFVTVDAECFFFLHDLITSYLRERDKMVAPVCLRSQTPDKNKSDDKVNGEEDDDEKLRGPAEFFSTDWRNFICKTWHLEPTVRLLSWGGKSIEPYGVDYILQKLGFDHARTTIPKWMQRGFMDPLDKVLSVLIYRMLVLAQDSQQRK